MKLNKLFVFLMLGIFMISFVSAFDFDNQKFYDENTKTATIKNCALWVGTCWIDGEILAELQLISPLNVKVGTGYQKVAEFSINNFKSDYGKAFQDMDFYDLKMGGKEITREFDYKYLTTESVKVIDYETICTEKNNVINGTYQDCKKEEAGFHWENVEKWEKFSDINELPPNEKVTIGIFTDVQVDDYVDWIPTFMGRKISEWATWEDVGLNANLISYYKFDEASGSVLDAQGTYNFSNQGATAQQIGKINYTYSYDGNDWINGTTFDKDDYNTGLSFNVWINITSTPTETYGAILNLDETASYGIANLMLEQTTNYIHWGFGNGSANTIHTGEDLGLTTGVWYMLTITHNTTNDCLYLNGAVQNCYVSGTLANGGTTMNIGRYNLINGWYFNGLIDELGIWGDDLTQTQITTLYNNGAGLALNGSTDASPLITLNSPTSANYTTVQNLVINFTASDDVNLTNVQLYVNDVLNQSNASGINNTNYLFDLDLGDGNYKIYGIATDNESQTTNSSSIQINIDSTFPTINVSYPTALINYGKLNGILELNLSATDSNLDSVWYEYENYEGKSQYLTSMDILLYDATCIGGNWNHTIIIPDSCKVDSYANITVRDYTSGLGPTYRTEYNCTNTTGNYIISDQSKGLGPFGSCIYNFRGKEIMSGAESGVFNISNITLTTQKNITIYANDTIGNLNATTFSWDYKVFENSFTFNNETRAGDTEDFTLNLTLHEDYDLSTSTFHYGNLTETPSIISSGTTRILEIEDYEIPGYTTDTNVSMYFTLILDDATQINTTEEVQLVQAIFLDNCSSYTYVLFNISLFDEREKTALLGDIEFNYDLLNKPSYNSINSVNLSGTNLSNMALCTDINLTNQNFAQSIEIRYTSEGYASEFYHIQRADITPEVTNINLYDLNSSYSTEFKITYQDNTFNFVEGAIIQLQRKYISEDVYEVVEAPLTSSEGTGLLHIDLDSVKYKITIVKNGVLLDTFDNLVFKCQSELTGECEQKLLGEIDPGNEQYYDTGRDLTYSVSESNGSITTSYSIPSGTPGVVNIVLTQLDSFGNETLCNKTITSSAGSIECDYSTTIGDSYLDLYIYKNGVPMAYQSYIIPEESGLDLLDNNFFIVFILLLSLVGMAVTSPEWIVVNSIITMVIAGSLFLLNGLNFVVGLGSLMWLVIAAAILIVKLAKQEDK